MTEPRVVRPVDWLLVIARVVLGGTFVLLAARKLQDPVAFLERFKDRVSHVHVKDVSASLAAAMRGELTGIAVSNTAIGDGVNVDNIKKCFDILVDIGYDGVVSIECEGEGGPMIEKSLAWVREIVADANRRLAARAPQAVA